MILFCFRCRDNTGHETDKRVGTKQVYRCTICENERTTGG